jgi:Fe-S-cluster containining protein
MTTDEPFAPTYPTVNPCVSCGACCALYRASFYFGEAGDFTPGGVDPELTEQITPFYRAMKGTNDVNPRCIALEGEIGVRVRCAVYANRPSCCHDVMPSLWDGRSRDDKCDRARERHGLAPLRREDWGA